LIAIPNDRLLQVADKRASCRMPSPADDVCTRHPGHFRVDHHPGLITLILPMCAIMRRRRGAHGVGTGTGDERAKKAAEDAISSNCSTSPSRARGVLFNVTGGRT